MNVAERKERYKTELAEIENEARKLISNIENALVHIDEVQTEEDIKEFSEKYDIEQGLTHIEIF